MWWATVVVFDKSQFSKDVFSMWQMVEQNYHHYANVFQFDGRKFRNDYALSIALLVANGNTVPEHCNIPWPLVNVEPAIEVSLDEGVPVDHIARKILYTQPGSTHNGQKLFGESI